jgi:hypothetical protein
VRTLLFITTGCALAGAQSSSVTYVPDIDGRPVPRVENVATPGAHTDLRQSINGKEVPIEQVDERVLSKNGSTTVTERIVKHYGAGGDVVQTDRILKEETIGANGDSVVKSRTYRSDLSGNMVEAERRTVETRRAGAGTVTDTAIEKRNLDNTLQLLEKRTATSEPTSDGKRENETVYLPDTNGNLHEAQRLATTETKSGNQVVSNTAVYEPGLNGNLSLVRQNVIKTTTNPDGSSILETEVFGRPSNGRTQDVGAPPALTEKRTTERQKGPGGAVVEVQTLQLPSISNPGQLDRPQKVAETICRGNCGQKP